MNYILLALLCLCIGLIWGYWAGYRDRGDEAIQEYSLLEEYTHEKVAEKNAALDEIKKCQKLMARYGDGEDWPLRSKLAGLLIRHQTMTDELVALYKCDEDA